MGYLYDELKRARANCVRLRKEVAALKSARIRLEPPVPSELLPLGDKIRVFEFRRYPPSVYFLVSHDGRIVYVGQSVDLARRIESHMDDKDFSHAYFLPVERPWDLSLIEAGFIRLLNPELNRSKGVTYSDPKPYLEQLGILFPKEERRDDQAQTDAL